VFSILAPGTRLCVSLVLLLAVSLGGDAGAGSVALGPAAGQLDQSFGAEGKVITDLGESELMSAAVAQPDGKIVVAGGTQDSAAGRGSQFFVARFLTDGRLDQSFGSGGMTRIGFGGRRSWANALALQADGKIVVAGGASPGVAADPAATADFALARLNRDGSRDGSFATGGIATTDFGGTGDVAVAIAVQPDGRVVVGGSARQPGPQSNPYDFALARYTSEGRLDTGFATGGHTSTRFGEGGYVASGIALQPDGKIVVVGTSFHEPLSIPPPVLALARYDANGTLDSTFSGDGWVTRAGAMGFDVAVVHGKIVVGGADNTLALFRYNGDGSPDRSFARGGVARAAGLEAAADKIAVQPDGEILAAGTGAGDDGHADFAVARFNPNGQRDPAFGTDGTGSTGFGPGSDDAATGLVQTGNGKIVLAGYTFPSPSGEGDIALARYYGKVCVVPNAVNTPLPTAQRSISKAECAVGKVTRVFSARVHTGRVVSQKPIAGTRQRLGAAVALTVSRGKRGH
jgi:uncharacterized delta-60 repeat protein